MFTQLKLTEVLKVHIVNLSSLSCQITGTFVIFLFSAIQPELMIQESGSK